jgi:Uma2 family endonuclease
MNAPKMVIAQDGLPRRLFRLADLDQMVAAGVIGHEERIELVGGELIPMAAKGIPHETLKLHLNYHFAAHRPPGWHFGQEFGWRIDDLNYLEPDFLFFPDGSDFAAVGGHMVGLAVEVSDSTLTYDRGRKARLYAEFGVAEYWAIDAIRRETLVYREPGRDGYAAIRSYEADETLSALRVPDLTLRLADLP